jgi:uncharacterized protein YbjT (DUF2867 family)
MPLAAPLSAPIAPLVAVAGITGYTGQRLLPLLSRDPAEVRLLMRPSSAKREPWASDPRVVGVDLLDETALEQALAGVSVIVSLVGTTKAQFAPAKDGEHAVSYATVDVGIPAALARAGKRAGAKRFVLLTSNGIESTPGAYAAAKRQAEALVKESGLAWVMVRPSFIVGPGRAAPRALDLFWAPVRLLAKATADDWRSIDVAVLARAIHALLASDAHDGTAVTGRALHTLGG